jgi:hypothetical protein
MGSFSYARNALDLFFFQYKQERTLPALFGMNLRSCHLYLCLPVPLFHPHRVLYVDMRSFLSHNYPPSTQCARIKETPESVPMHNLARERLLVIYQKHAKPLRELVIGALGNEDAAK